MPDDQLSTGVGLAVIALVIVAVVGVYVFVDASLFPSATWLGTFIVAFAAVGGYYVLTT